MSNLFEIGLYSVASASRLTHIPARDIRRWLYGYSAPTKDYESLWQDELTERNLSAEGLGFLDLIEVQIVNGLRKRGVSLQSIRLALDHAREIYGMARPFAHERFFTDGKTVLMKIVDDAGDEHLLDLCRRQMTMEEIVRPFIKGVIEYSDEIASLWFPVEQKRDVVVDPRKAFGRPILAASAIPTEALYQAFVAEGDTTMVASLYEISSEQVQAAIEYEESLNVV